MSYSPLIVNQVFQRKTGYENDERRWAGRRGFGRPKLVSGA